eukprot:NODE_780_length_4291_cov_0.447758.p2 type:complete len:141 gc:universal NODE_780_length_4291_cov_0.447758:1794-2216(+)
MLSAGFYQVCPINCFSDFDIFNVNKNFFLNHVLVTDVDTSSSHRKVIDPNNTARSCDRKLKCDANVCCTRSNGEFVFRLGIFSPVQHRMIIRGAIVQYLANDVPVFVNNGPSIRMVPVNVVVNPVINFSLRVFSFSKRTQ